MITRKTCCIGGHRMRWWQKAPQWGHLMCRDHYWAGFFPPADPASIAAIFAEPSPFTPRPGGPRE